MTEKDTPEPAALGPEDPEAASATGKARHPKPYDHLVSPGAESTRELRELARRRREAEEKLQQHLKEAKKPDDS